MNVHQPMRDDDVARWLKTKRDYFDREDGGNGGWNAWCVIDALLDEYRLRADCGYGLAGDPPTEGDYDR